MLIQKQFKFEGAHIVHDAYSRRCSYSVHGHSYRADIGLYAPANALGPGQMVMDFGLMKSTVPMGLFWDMLDHTMLISNWAPQEYQDDMKKYSERWVIMPANASAEMIALWGYVWMRAMLENVRDANPDQGWLDDVSLSYVRVHETRTGFAEADEMDALEYGDDRSLITDTYISNDLAAENPWFESVKGIEEGSSRKVFAEDIWLLPAGNI